MTSAPSRQQMGVRVQPDPQPARNIFIRSDQYSFVKQGVPPSSPASAMRRVRRKKPLENKWLEERYHAPSDDLNQPVDKPAAGQFNELIGRLLERVANADTNQPGNRLHSSSVTRANRCLTGKHRESASFAPVS